ncbi:hypothetical protein VKT23_015904 [Stygiomarasmius scandens]|uniref:BTB domain-containing protein n=1 Tax=Marasmiellus scandens TaxID=2682957 RepID=A0ABR1J0R2_9AGAR
MSGSQSNVSSLFNSDTGGDVIFSSLDNCLFYLHQENLELFGGNFPLALAADGGVVYLTEGAPILELLFSYIYPDRLPVLDDLSFETLIELARAAEKYKVYIAKSQCALKMLDYVQLYPRQIYGFGLTYGYPFLREYAMLQEESVAYDV